MDNSSQAEGISYPLISTGHSFDSLFWQAERIGIPSTWWQHVPFGRWIVCATQPKVLVELGTHAGVSYTAFCQAVARSGLDTRCCAVGTWRGDPHAGAYGEEVFDEFQRFHERYSAFSTLLRMTSDEALCLFTDGSVDLLHVDDLHSYEAVRHYFESWKPKLSQRAIVLFHDTNERKDDFGVWRLWTELCECFPHFQFIHGHGLGVLAVGKNVEPPILTLCHLSDPSSMAAVRNQFAALGERFQSQTREQLLAQDLGLVAIGEHAELLRRRVAKLASQTEQAKALAQQAEQSRRAAEARAKEADRALEQVRLRIRIARRDVYDANLRAEDADRRAEDANLRAEEASIRAEDAREALVQCDRALRERDALLSSTAWRVTYPLRAVASRMPPQVRRALRRGAKFTWWSLTSKLRRKLHKRHIALAPCTPVALPEPEALQIRDSTSSLPPDPGAKLRVSATELGASQKLDRFR